MKYLMLTVFSILYMSSVSFAGSSSAECDSRKQSKITSTSGALTPTTVSTSATGSQ